MSTRISYGKNTPLSFRESLRFNRESPYKIRYKDFANEDIAPLHYAETIEIDVCCGIQGEVVVGNQRFDIDGDMAYVILPGTVHSTTIHKGPGHIYVLHISLEALSEFIGVAALMEQSGKSFSGVDCICPEFGKIHDLVQELIRCDNQPFPRARALMDILALIVEKLPDCEAPVPAQMENRNTELFRILRWSEAHFTEPVRLEEAAAVVGFSKNYFCCWFKNNTGLTYSQYLNNLRVNHACRLLVQTGSISAACYDSGFRDMSYFIQTFKKTQGCTPKTYIRNSAAE